MIATFGESFELKLYKRKKNSSYEWEDTPTRVFFGRPANAKEKKNYRIQQGVQGNAESLYILCSNLPNDVKPKDMIIFNGDEYTVETIGVFYENSRIVNNHIMSSEYIDSRCPKGITLQ